MLRPGGYAVASPGAAFSHRAGQAWEQVVLPLHALAVRAPLLLSPANMAPLGWPRNVVVMHDAAALRHPAWYSRAYLAWHRFALPLLARRAVHVITVSEFSRAELVELLDLSPERISVVAGGVDERFHPQADSAAARAAHGLTRPYVLTVASRTARKNVAALAATAGRLARRGLELVAAGGDRPQFADEGAVPGLRALGHVDDALLPGLYAGAEAFVLPSLYEGFGLPCLEAMAAGVPVVASRQAALAETCGSVAVLVDPLDQGDIADAVERVLDDAELRGRLRAQGPLRAAGFRWASTAERVDAVLHDLAPGAGPAAAGSPDRR